MPDQIRIKSLDGLRCFCVTLVVLFHYLTRYTHEIGNVDYYPYHDVFWSFYPAHYGYLGVPCFFIISGFVIFMTLERTSNRKQFFAKRFIRIWPTLVICSILTFVVATFLPFPFIATSWIDFGPSLTITHPDFWRLIFHIPNIDFIDGVEWSLVCEVLFYIVAGLLYFFKKTCFYIYWMIFSISIIILSFALKLFSIPHTELIDILLFPRYLIYFTIGIYFYHLWRHLEMSRTLHVATYISAVFQMTVFLNYKEDFFLILFMICFLLSINGKMNFISKGIISTTGYISYTIYLLHSMIGLILINRFAVLFNTTSPVFLISITIFIIWLLSYAIEISIHKNITPYLKHKLLISCRKPSLSKKAI